MSINIHIPNKAQNLRPMITVVGVGGAGGNAVNNMIASSLEGCTFIVANTDAQALDASLCDKRIQLGINQTQGLGAGAMPAIGRSAAEESLDEIEGYILGSHMLFITAGMGGGTGTGAAPVIAKIAKENDILTVGVVTKPFHFEGSHRMKIADEGIAELQKYVDTLIVIPNQNLFRIANERTTFADAFKMADEVLHAGVRGITDLMMMPGLINLDFADIRTVMSEMGKAMMGTGEAEGDRRAIDAAEAAISNPLLDDISMKGARGVLINITGGPDLTLFEVDEAANRIREEVDPNANIIFGSTFNKDVAGKVRVSVVATGIGLAEQQARAMESQAPQKVAVNAPRAAAPAQPLFQQPIPQAKPVAQAQPQQAPVQQQIPLARVEPAFEEKYEEKRVLEEVAPAQTFRTAVEEPVAVAPRQEPRVQNVAPRAEGVAHREPARQAPKGGQQQAGAFSFFQKFGMGKLTPSAQPEPRQSREPRLAGNEEGRKSPSDDDYLEVPAFLRRNPNG